MRSPNRPRKLRRDPATKNEKSGSVVGNSWDLQHAVLDVVRILLGVKQVSFHWYLSSTGIPHCSHRVGALWKAYL